MTSFLNRGLSLAIYSAYLLRAYAKGPEVVLVMATILLLPMACIWFPEALGEYAGTAAGQLITSSTPACLVRAGGWLVLVGAPIIGYLLHNAL
jgi:hypothetical protein